MGKSSSANPLSSTLSLNASTACVTLPSNNTFYAIKLNAQNNRNGHKQDHMDIVWIICFPIA